MPDLRAIIRHRRSWACRPDALAREGVAGFLEQVGGVQQRLGRYATDVQAGAAETRLALGVGVWVDSAACGLETELRCTDRGDAATRATTDDETSNSLEPFHLSLPKTGAAR